MHTEKHIWSCSIEIYKFLIYSIFLLFFLHSVFFLANEVHFNILLLSSWIRHVHSRHIRDRWIKYYICYIKYYLTGADEQSEKKIPNVKTFQSDCMHFNTFYWYKCTDVNLQMWIITAQNQCWLTFMWRKGNINEIKSETDASELNHKLMCSVLLFLVTLHIPFIHQFNTESVETLDWNKNTLNLVVLNCPTFALPGIITTGHVQHHHHEFPCLLVAEAQTNTSLCFSFWQTGKLFSPMN